MAASSNNNNSNDDNEHEYYANWPRQYRHNPCFMTPLSFVMFIIFGFFMFLSLLFQLPMLVLGFLLAPILQRTSFYVEFLYPMNIARYFHFLLIRHAPKGSGRGDDKNRGFHSRTLEQRIEVVPGRVYIHMMPQWLDNIGYLVVCLPDPNSERNSSTTPIIAFMIDCGDAEETARGIELIMQHHYKTKKSIQLQAIMSTHKHHDHTGGNKGMLSHPKFGEFVKKVHGGAVERVPHANSLLKDGDDIMLPCVLSNDMNSCVGLEAVAVPSHTRGSMVYRLYSKSNAQVEYLFTGDTMFSGGCGMPFEADTGGETEAQIGKSHGNTFFRGGTGNNAIERCCAEILTRGLPRDLSPDASERILILPGHEYTSELLSRQFQATTEACKWKNFAPKEFFETAANFYVAQHRRSLPHNSGRILMVPSTIRKEISISPHFRNMRRNGEMVVRSIHFWYTNFCKEPLNNHPQDIRNGDRTKKTTKKQLQSKTPPTPGNWNIDAGDVNRDVFTTVYAADLDTVIDSLTSGRISKTDAAKQLREMSNKLSAPVVNKRAIPGFLPSDRNIYRGAVSGMALIGSRPCAMSISDSKLMRLAPPNDRNSDKILISANRLLRVLSRIGLVDRLDDTSLMLMKLWKKASEYVPKTKSVGNGYSNGDVESGGIVDEIELGILKWVIYGVPANQPSWFSKMCCMPCSSKTAPSPYKFENVPHPAKGMNQKSGDLVAHDVLTCYLCESATGCIHPRRTPQTIPSLNAMETVSDTDESMELDIEELSSQLLLKEHE